MKALLGIRRAPKRASTDRVLPLYFLDRSAFVTNMNTAAVLVFDEVLDPEKLRTSLEGLVKRKGWERLGARIRESSTNGLEWHIPVEFTTSRPAIHFVHVDHGMSSSAHPVASNIPKASSNGQPAVVGFPSALAPLVWGPRAKSRTLDDYLTSDLPVTSLRVNSFTDKTIVALEWHHTVFDAIGMQYVFEGWQSMLWGRDDEIPTPFDKDSDPFATLGQGTWSAGQKHVLADRQLRMASLLRWVLRYFVDNYARKSEIRIVCIPEASWRGWLDKALEELRAEAVAKGADPSSVFLTENDIVSAWLLKHTVEYMNPNWMVQTTTLMSLRKAFEGDVLPRAADKKVFYGNSFGFGNALARAGDLASKPLSWLAQQIRASINEQGTRAQHDAYFSMVRASKIGLPIVAFGDKTTRMVYFTNWTKVGLYRLDFAPARKGPSNTNEPCRSSYIQENHHFSTSDVFEIIGKDADGNYWVSGRLLKAGWTKFERLLKKDVEVSSRGFSLAA